MNVPKLRFKDNNGNNYPQWNKYTFNDLANYKKGPFGSSLKKDIFVPKSNNSTKIYEQQNAINKNWKLERYFISNEYAQKLKSFKVEAGDIIVSCAGTIGETYLLPNNAETGIINQALMRIKVNTNFILKYIFLIVFKKMLNNVNYRFSNGSAIKNIPPLSDLKNIIITIPCLEEQIKITDFLSTIDKKIENLNATIENLEQQKKGLMQQIFSQKLRFKDENGNYYPNWKEQLFSDIFSFLSTNSCSRTDMNEQYGTVKNIHYGDVLIKFNHIIDLSKHQLPHLPNYNSIPKDVLKKKLEKQLIKNGDIVIADTAEDYTAGKVCEIININDNLVVSGLHTMLCRPEPNLFVLGFLGYFMNSYTYHHQLLRLITGTKVCSIIKKEIVKTKILIPCLEEQQKIADFLSTFDRKIDNQKAQLEHWQQIKKGLLQQMFI